MSLAGAFQTQVEAAEGNDVLPLAGLDSERVYELNTHAQRVFVRRFGALLSHIMPFSVNPNGPLLRWIDRSIPCRTVWRRIAQAGAR